MCAFPASVQLLQHLEVVEGRKCLKIHLELQVENCSNRPPRTPPNSTVSPPPYPSPSPFPFPLKTHGSKLSQDLDLVRPPACSVGAQVLNYDPDVW